MKLLLLFGNSSAGKMTVGQELAKITPLRLFHNHMMIEPVLEIFGDFRGDIIHKLRSVVLDEFGKSDNYGLIFTYMMAFDMPSEWEYLQSVKDSLGVSEEDVYYAELVAPQSVRLARNGTENRLLHKASKRDMTRITGWKACPEKSPLPTISALKIPTFLPRKPLPKSRPILVSPPSKN